MKMESKTKATKIKEVFAHNKAAPDVVIKGWIRTKRDSKSFSFLEINDGSTIKNLQIIADSKLTNYESEVKKLTLGSSVEVHGDLVESPGKGQKIEMHAKKVHVYGFCDPVEYPLQKKELTADYLRTIAHMRPRTQLFSALLRLRSELAFAIHKFFNEKGFYYMHTPIITSSDCEGAGSMFQATTLDLEHLPKTKDGKIDYSKDFFTKKAFLTVSGQLEGEIFATAIGQIYTFGPTFRAECSNTTRHVAEFWMMEPEMAFYDMHDLMDIEEEMSKYLINHVMERCKDDLAYLIEKNDPTIYDRLKNIVSNEFKRVSYTEAIEILKKADKKFDVLPEWGIDLGTEHERYLAEQHFKCPVMVYNYPKNIKPFYMKQNDDGKTVRGVDVLFPGVGEIMGSGQREEEYDKLSARIEEMKLCKEDYWWYLETRKFGTIPHSGFGLGFDRFLMFLTGITNIRDVIPLPRAYRQLEY